MQHRRIPRVGAALLPALATLLVTVTAAAQDAPTAGPIVRPAPPRLLSQFDVGAGTVQTLAIVPDAAGVFRVTVALGASKRTLVLSPHDVRAPGFRLLVQDATGVHQAPTPPCVTYRGWLAEDPATGVVATIVDGGLTAIVYGSQPGPEWIVQPVRAVSASAGQALHIVYRAVDGVALPFHCGAATGPLQPAPATTGVDVTRICDIAIEGDVQFYQQNGSNVVATQNDITGVMNQVDFIFDRDTDVQFVVTTILVTTTALYTTNDPSGLLSQFGANWSSNHAGIQRDVAHLFTGRNLSGSVIGIANLGAVCNSGSGYALSQSRFSSNFNRRVGLTAHELGHNFGALHCNGVNPCYIMCSGLGGCSGNVTLFGPTEANQIISFAASAGCLTVVQVPPVITSITPAVAPVFDPGFAVLAGTGFTGVTSYRLGSQTYTSGFNVQSDTSIIFPIPPSTTLGQVTVDVTNAVATSNPVPLTYDYTQPPRIVQPGSLPPVGGTVTIDFAGYPGRLWFLVVSLQNSTTPFQGFGLLSNPVTLSMGVFPQPLGISSFSTPVPGGLGLLVVYGQILEVDTATLNPTGVSEIGFTVLL